MPIPTQLPPGRLLPGLLALAGCGAADDPTARGPDAPDYVGRATCALCHDLEYQLWRGSHHDLAMQEATPETVLGDFDGVTFEHFGDTTTLRRDGERFLVETDGPGGTPGEYEVAYVFGVDPLQQLLIPFEDGRMQALSVAWDSRPAADGGQRWFHLYPDEPIPAGDLLHWTGPQQNWNGMCADCHSTGLARGYDLESDRFETTWEELNVSCEACHGPGSKHVAWAKDELDDDGRMGLAISLKDPAGGEWAIDEATGNALRSAPRGSRAQVETCARCHARRALLREGPVDDRPFLDSHRLALLEEPLYWPDGQIRDEVYVYGSFLQSNMYAQGVTCSDCHDPHSGRTFFPGNQLCARCHLPEKYDAPSHHHHQIGSTGAQCVECHMPERTYMVVDPRRDHSLRVPRPDLSVALGTPNACQRCHDDRPAEEGAEWAAESVREWFPEGRSGTAHFGQALHAARIGSPQAGPLLAQLAADPEAAGISRASALSHLPSFLGEVAFGALIGALEDPDPLVRAAAVSALEGLPPAQRLPFALPHLEDDVLGVRVEAARVLAAVPPEVQDAALRRTLERGYEEYRRALLAVAERAGSHLSLGLLALDRGRLDEAQAEYETALALDPHFVLAAVNLADLHRERGQEEDAERVLRGALACEPQAAALHHALGLAQVRTGRLPEAVESLGQAAGLAPESPRYTFVWAIALSQVGDGERALVVLEDAQRRHPYDREILQALATMQRDAGDLQAAVRYAEALAALAPGDPDVARLLEELRGARDE